MNKPDSIPTRASLVARLKDCDDQESWREFFDTYWRLIHSAALSAGLTAVEADEVVQEVVIAVARKMPEFTYNPATDSLKGWLLSVTRWKVADQFRLRMRASNQCVLEPDDSRTAAADRVPAPDEMNSMWEAEWAEHMVRVARERVKKRVNPAHYEIYHLHVIQGLSARETARALSVSSAAVHLAKFRVQQLLKRELKDLGPQ